MNCRIKACSFEPADGTGYCLTHYSHPRISLTEMPRERVVMTPEQYDRWHFGFCNGTAPCPLCDAVEVAE